MCYRVETRMECLECEYPASEARFRLNPKVPHTSLEVGKLLYKLSKIFEEFENTQMLSGGQDLSFVDCGLELIHLAESLPPYVWANSWNQPACWYIKE